MAAIVKYNFHVFYLFCLFVIGVFYYPNYVTASVLSNRDIMSDYFWGSAELRSRPLTCDTQILQLICLNKCGKDFICEKDKCKCKKSGDSVKIMLRVADAVEPESHANKETDISLTDKFSPAVLQIQQDTSIKKASAEKKTLEPDHPALRHHIAHFCPNLDDARQCIRGCMKLGKPAFCGKDHVCYCGHKYTSHDKDKKLNVHDMYSQFRDLYEKYFGPQTPEIGGAINHHDDDDDDDNDNDEGGVVQLLDAE